MRPLVYGLLLGLCWIMPDSLSAADVIPINQDESKVPPYTLPDPLVSLQGKVIDSAGAWQKIRRLELIELFRSHVYGRAPGLTERAPAQVIATDPQALGGRATRRIIRVPLTANPQGLSEDILLYLPNSATGPVPVFLGLNFDGNYTVTTDPGVPLIPRWVPNRPKLGVTNNVAQESARGSDADSWPIERILERGFGLATVYCGDIEPDHPQGWKQGIRAALAPQGTNQVFAADDWGAIGAWAWGLSRALDALEHQPGVDAQRVAVIGHSRLGKTALWAGAQDSRFSLVISNESGEGGAALARRWFGETVWRINTSFPHWFCGRFKDYNQNVNALPVDQHELIALSAPRPIYVASAQEDLWADPKGEFLSAKHAEPIYALFGKKGLGVPEQPPADTPVGDVIGYHVRSGKHDLTRYDWEQYLNFADRQWKASP